MKKFLMLSCSTGEGHNSAAKAVCQHLQSLGHHCEMMDPTSLKSKKVSDVVASAYNGTIKNIPAFFGIVYKIGRLYELSRLPSPVYWANAKYAKKLAEYITAKGFDGVICSHMFCMMAMTEARKKYGLQVPCYGIVTDYTIIPFMSNTDVDGYFVPTDSIKDMLATRRIAKDKIFVTGIPVKDDFRAEVDKKQTRDTLGISQDKKMVVVLSGGAGCGKISKLCKKLDKALDDGHEIYVFPGHNQKMQDKLTKRYDGYHKIKIVPFTPEVHLYIKVADVVLSKPGGLSSTEIAVANVPFVHLKAIPGCETANVKYFSQNGMSIKTRHTKQAAQATAKLLADKTLCDRMKQKQKNLIPGDAVDKICDIVK